MRKATFAVGALLAGALTAGAAATVSYADPGWEAGSNSNSSSSNSSSSSSSSSHERGAGPTQSTAVTAPTTLACPAPYVSTATQILGTDVLICAKPARGRHDRPTPTVTVTAPPSTATVTVTAPATSTTTSTTPPSAPPAVGGLCRTQGERAVGKNGTKLVCALGTQNRLRWRILS